MLWLTSQSLSSKATTLERTYGPAWIAYGHSFAVESEHDQAMAAYFTAAQLMKGCVDNLAFDSSVSIFDGQNLIGFLFEQVSPAYAVYRSGVRTYQQPQAGGTFLQPGLEHRPRGPFRHT